MADDAATFDVGADHEAGHVGEKQQRNVERVAQPDKARGFIRRVVEQHATLLHRLVRKNSNSLPVKASETCEQLLGEELLDLEPAAFVDDGFDELPHVVATVRFSWYQVAGRLRQSSRGFCVGGRRLFARPQRHVFEVGATELDRLLVICDQRVPTTALRAVHAGATELLEAHLLADDDLDHARRSEVHRSVALDHHDDVAEGGYVGAPCGGRPEEQADLRHLAGQLHLVEEDASRVTPAGEHVDLVSDPRAGGVDEVEEGHADAGGGFLDAHDLFHGAGAPAAGLDRGVVGHDGDLPAFDRAQPGDHSVRRQFFGQHVGEEPIFDEGALVQQQVEALARRELVLLTKLWQVSRSALQRLFAQLAVARIAQPLPSFEVGIALLEKGLDALLRVFRQRDQSELAVEVGEGRRELHVLLLVKGVSA